jgi:predicted aspartyl protease
MAFTRNDIPKWTAYIHGNEVQVALDSGAENSVISIQALKRLNLKMRDKNESIETSNGEIVQVKSTDPIEIVFESIPANLSFNITNLKAVDILLGIDWFKQTGVILDPKNDAFILPQRTVKTNQVNDDNDLFSDDDELTYSLSSLTLDHENIDDEYIDDYACFNNNDLNLDNLAPKTQISEKNTKEFRNYLKNNREMFATSVDQLGCCKNEAVVKSKPRRTHQSIMHHLDSRLR